MDVLHITDLHVTEPNTSLESVWSTVDDVLSAHQRSKFDFIVVSGELTQAAKREEYDQVRRFTETELVPRLRRHTERNRVIFVPGNHDVTWSHPHRAAVEQAEAPPARCDRTISEGAAQVRDPRAAHQGRRHRRSHPGSGPLRPAVLGDPEVPRRVLTRAARPQRPFQLTSAQPRDHCSAHVFREDGIAFYGFNTCFCNDEVWRGAMLEDETVTAAVAHARTHARDLIWVAVWHHGLVSGFSRRRLPNPVNDVRWSGRA